MITTIHSCDALVVSSYIIDRKQQPIAAGEPRCDASLLRTRKRTQEYWHTKPHQHTPTTHKGNKSPKKQNKEKTGQHNTHTTHQKKNKDQEKKSAQKLRTNIYTTLSHVLFPLRFSLL